MKMNKKQESLWLLAREGKCSPRKAIKAMCQQCVCYQDVPKGIKSCESSLCPLWVFRPYQKKD